MSPSADLMPSASCSAFTFAAAAPSMSAWIRSVRAFRRRGVPIRNIGIDEGSATSVALLRILLARRYADEMAPAVGFTPIAPTTRPDELPHDLVLLIGDAGLAADPGSREVWDLGQQWRALTGLPFVFALWLLRPVGAAVSARA